MLQSISRARHAAALFRRQKGAVERAERAARVLLAKRARATLEDERSAREARERAGLKDRLDDCAHAHVLATDVIYAKCGLSDDAALDAACDAGGAAVGAALAALEAASRADVIGKLAARGTLDALDGLVADAEKAVGHETAASSAVATERQAARRVENKIFVIRI